VQIVCVSRGSHNLGQEFAESLAKKLGFKCLSREDLVARAVDEGIPVSKLEMAMSKQASFSEALAAEKEHYQALLCSILCEEARSDNIVYTGWTGHLLLRGIGHVLRIRVVADLETRIKTMMQRTRLSRKQVLDFIEKVEDDRRRWARCFYGVEWDASSHYDLILNMERMNVDNAAASVCNIAGFPEFQPTPASQKAMEDLCLAARARVALARAKETAGNQLTVHADGGTVSVTYLPQQSRIADAIPDILRGVDGVQDIICTVASSNILWIAETFSPEAPAFGHLTQIAEKWNAAVELLRLRPKGPEAGDAGDGGAKETVGALIERGRAGGSRAVIGGQKTLLSAIDPRVPYSLIVVGSVFLDKGAAVRTRMTRDLASFLFDKLHRPVVLSEELAVQYLFGPAHLAKLIVFLLATAGVYAGVFTHQVEVLSFFRMDGHLRLVSVAAVLAVVPAFAYLYGSAVKLALKAIKME